MAYSKEAKKRAKKIKKKVKTAKVEFENKKGEVVKLTEPKVKKMLKEAGLAKEVAEIISKDAMKDLKKSAKKRILKAAKVEKEIAKSMKKESDKINKAMTKFAKKL